LRDTQPKPKVLAKTNTERYPAHTQRNNKNEYKEIPSPHSKY
jgi:hypothetical protein